MKKTLFSVIFTILSMLLIIGWALLPSSLMYKGVYVDNKLSDFGYIWSDIGCCSLLLLSIISLMEIGKQIFEWFKK